MARPSPHSRSTCSYQRPVLTRISREPELSCLTDQTFQLCSAAPPRLLIKFYVGQSRAISRLSSRQNSISSSTSSPPLHSGSQCRRRCCREPTRWSNKACHFRNWHF